MNTSSIGKAPFFAALTMASLLLGACESVPPPAPSAILAPVPIQGNTGKYMSPYTSDGVVAEWVDKGVNARIGAGVGSAAGSYVGSQVMGQIPFVGGMLGQAVGDEAGRQVAISMSGGEEYIRKTSDLSFNSIDELAVWLYAVHSTDKEHFDQVFKETCSIYPELTDRYMPAIQSARRRDPNAPPTAPVLGGSK
jgi:hypothetical protein